MHITKWDLSEPVRKDSSLPWYLPSINSMFAKPMGMTTKALRPGNIPKTLPDPEKLNFLLPSSFYYYPACLYSAGVADLDIASSRKTDRSILRRDRSNTFIMADSGGYQVATNKLEIDWKNPESTLERILDWQQHMCNVGMHLEIPVRASRIEESVFHGRRDACIEQSKQNFEFFEKTKRDDFELIIPIHGDDIAEAINWYEEVKNFDGCGWAVGGQLGEDYATLLLLIHHIHKDGGFSGKRGQYFHLFGKGTGKAGIVASVLQYTMRRMGAENIRVTFDASSPVKMGGRFANVYEEPTFAPAEQIPRQQMNSFSEGIKGLNQSRPYPYAKSAVLDDINVEDILNLLSNSKYGMDGLAYSVLASHNVCVAVQTIYGTLHRAHTELQMVSEQLSDQKASGKPMKPYVSWDDALTNNDVGAWMYTLIAATGEVLAQLRTEEAIIMAQGKWKELFNTAFDFKKTLDIEEDRFDFSVSDSKAVNVA